MKNYDNALSKTRTLKEANEEIYHHHLSCSKLMTGGRRTTRMMTLTKKSHFQPLPQREAVVAQAAVVIRALESVPAVAAWAQKIVPWVKSAVTIALGVR